MTDNPHNRQVRAMHRLIKVIVLMIPTLMLAFAAQAEEVSKVQIKGLDEQVQEIKGDILGIAVELNQLEEKLLYPSGTQVAIFVSLGQGETLQPDSLEIRLGDRSVATHLYTYKELEALQKGGVQRIFTGNLRTGDHQLEAILIGRSQGGGDIRRTEKFTVHKDVGPKIVELTLAGGDITLEDW